MFALPAEKKWQIYCSKKKVSHALTMNCTVLDLKITWSIYSSENHMSNITSETAPFTLFSFEKVKS